MPCQSLAISSTCHACRRCVEHCIACSVGQGVAGPRLHLTSQLFLFCSQEWSDLQSLLRYNPQLIISPDTFHADDGLHGCSCRVPPGNINVDFSHCINSCRYNPDNYTLGAPSSKWDGVDGYMLLILIPLSLGLLRMQLWPHGAGRYTGIDG